MEDPWRAREQDQALIQELSRTSGLDPLIARCLLNRGIKEREEIESYFDPSRDPAPDPFLMPDMAAAVARIELALARRERICIYGDSDADGVTAIAILLLAIRELGGEVFHHIPDRIFEGVGLNSERLRIFKEELGVGLVITVDTGIRSFEQLAFAERMGLDLIITDHHTPDAGRPDAFAVLNPKIPGSSYPFDGLCGAGLALKLVQALDLRMPHRLELARYFKIAAIGTIADMVPLRGENRALVAHGLAVINQEREGAVRILLSQLGIRGPVGALDISFKVAPRINAPGRLGDPDLAIDFFVENDPAHLAFLVEAMDGMNRVRQMIERELDHKLESQLRFREAPPFILIEGSFWHRGILGILACKLTRRYNRPACVLSLDNHNAYGSLRSIHGIDLLKPLHELAPLLRTFGGHSEAAGVSLPLANLPLFRQRMTELLEPQVAVASQRRQYAIDAELRWNQLDRRLLEKIQSMAPFGIGNAAPVFVTRGLILETEPQRRGQWLHFDASDGQLVHRCTFYQPTARKSRFERFDSVDLLYSLSSFRDEYQIQVLDIRHSMH